MRIIQKIRDSKIIHNASWIIFCRVYQAALNLVVAMLTARYMGPTNYGLISYAASLTATLTAVSTLGTNDILVNELVTRENKSGEILGTTIFYRICSSVLCVITICLFAKVSNPDDSLTVIVVFLYSLSLLFQAFESIKYWYQAHLLSKIPSLISCIAYTVVAIYKFYLLATKKSVVWFAISYSIDYCVVAILLLCSYNIRQRKAQPLKVCPKKEHTILQRSTPFIASGLMVSVYAQMDKIMINSMLGQAQVGYYSVASTISTAWTFLLSAIIDSAKPLILTEYQKDYKIYKKNLMLLYAIIIGISILFAAGISIFSQVIIYLMYGTEYLPASNALSIVTWSTAFSYLGVARSIWVVPQGLQKYEKYIAGAGACCNLILNYCLIPTLGINGAALATLLTQVFTNLIVGFFIKDIRTNNIMIFKSLLFWRNLK